MCSVNQICPRPRTPLVELPRFPANAAHAVGGFFHGAVMKIIKLTQGKESLVDNGDYAKVSKFKWCAGKSKQRWVAQTGVIGNNKSGRTTLLLHRFIMGSPAGKDVDHKNGNTLDNRKRNLRITSNLKNLRAFRRKENGTSKFRGVYWHKRIKKWQAGICKNYKIYFLGYFNDEKKAARAYDFKAIALGFERQALNQYNQTK